MLRTWRLHVLRAVFEDGVSVELPLQPPSALPFAAMFFAGAAQFAYEPRPGARSREEHLTGSEAWPTGLKMYQRDYHAKFWILALLHERLTKQFVEKRGGAPEGSDKGAARNYIRFQSELHEAFGCHAAELLGKNAVGLAIFITVEGACECRLSYSLLDGKLTEAPCVH